ncbi:MAG: M1 family metallopeptidase [Bacteroidales bacterium]|nr:M1 family metallopeptidase [Bacteroidales bacterium]
MTRNLIIPLITFILFLSAFIPEKDNISNSLSHDPNSRTDTFNVVHYTINLIVPDIKDKQVYGIVDLQIQPLIKDIDTITLDLFGFSVDSIWIENETIINFSYDGRFIDIPVKDEIHSKSSVVMSVFYHGTPSTDPGWGGFYFKDNVAYNMGVGMKSYPHGVGRYWYPCVDNFVDRATYDYFIRVPENYTAVCPGELKETYLHNDNSITWHWFLEDNIPTYLSSVAISEYEVIRDTLKGIERMIPSSVYIRPDLKNKADSSFSEIEKYLAVLENYFGPYRWQRVGYVGVPFSGGAMEHATNIAISESTITGNHRFETLYFHELAHSWFGNMVTCRTSGDMWLNEGWASYCEALFIDHKYGKEKFMDYIRDNHYKVLMYAHLRDNGMRAVYGIPKEFTYGSTVYDKGSDVVHTLRNYLGDDKFFPAVRKYLDKYAFNDASTEDLKNILSDQTETNLDDFFKSWIYSPGFTHFSIDTFMVHRNENSYDVNVVIEQKLKGGDELYNLNRIEITFMNDIWEKEAALFGFSGRKGENHFELPFKPTIVLLDIEEKVSDAITGYTRVLKETGEYEFDASFFRQSVKQITDSALLRVEYHWVTPDTIKSKEFNGKFLTNGYWSVNGIFPEDYDATGYFKYFSKQSRQSAYVDSTLLVDDPERLVILFREKPEQPWRQIPSGKSNKELQNEVIVKHLSSGDYIMGQITGF